MFGKQAPAPMALCAWFVGELNHWTSTPDSPVHNVTFWSAVRFANWMSNGQGSGSETGAYDLTDSDAITNNTVTRTAGMTAVRATPGFDRGPCRPSMNAKAGWYQSSGSGDSDDYWAWPQAVIPGRRRHPAC